MYFVMYSLVEYIVKYIYVLLVMKLDCLWLHVMCSNGLYGITSWGVPGQRDTNTPPPYILMKILGLILNGITKNY